MPCFILVFLSTQRHRMHHKIRWTVIHASHDQQRMSLSASTDLAMTHERHHEP